MSISSFRHMFQLAEGVTYLNHAYMSPLPYQVEQAGIEGLKVKKEPWKITPAHFFEGALRVRNKFGQLINGLPERVAIIPSASYGLMAACNNIDPQQGDHGIVVAEEFPSGYYALEAWCQKNEKDLITVSAPKDVENRGSLWNERILNAINPQTAAIVLSSVHWTDGTKFDLEAISKKCKECEALLIVDGSQSIGAMPYDQEIIHADALICAGYKWLMGPYSSGLAYYGPAFDEGQPLEVSWLNKEGAIHFHQLTSYTPHFDSAAARYNVGEYSHFIHMPMIEAALDLLLEWTPAQIQQHGIQLSQHLESLLNKTDFKIEKISQRAGHIVGFRLPEQADIDGVLMALRESNIYVSRRGSSLRASFHLYNDQDDVNRLCNVLNSRI